MCPRAKFHASSSNCSLLNAVKAVTKEFCPPPPPKETPNKNSAFSHDLLPYIVSGSKNVSGLMNSESAVPLLQAESSGVLHCPILVPSLMKIDQWYTNWNVVNTSADCVLFSCIYVVSLGRDKEGRLEILFLTCSKWARGRSGGIVPRLHVRQPRNRSSIPTTCRGYLPP
jgi:hypothetical protein